MTGRGRRRRSRGLALVAAATVSLSGCGAMLGGASTAPDGTPLPSIDELYSATRTATLGADSGHVTGFVVEEVEGREVAVTVDLEGVLDGTNQRLKVTDDRSSSVVLTVGESYYVTGDWDFWADAIGPQVATGLVDRHVEVARARAQDLGPYTIQEIVEDIMEPTSLGLLDRAGSSVSLRIDGDRTVIVGETRNLEFWVDQRSRRLVRLVSLDTVPGGELVFDRWDEAKTFRTPKRIVQLDG